MSGDEEVMVVLVVRMVVRMVMLIGIMVDTNSRYDDDSDDSDGDSSEDGDGGDDHDGEVMLVIMKLVIGDDGYYDGHIQYWC